MSAAPSGGDVRICNRYRVVLLELVFLSRNPEYSIAMFGESPQIASASDDITLKALKR